MTTVMTEHSAACPLVYNRRIGLKVRVAHLLFIHTLV